VTGEAAPFPATPTGRWSYEVTARSSAPVEAVWPLLGEARRWKEWSFLDRSDLIREGDPAPDGVGAVRRFTRFGVGSREEVVAWDPPRHLGYVILKGFPVRRYRADVNFSPEGTGTLIRWSASFDALIPGTGRLMSVILRSMIGRFADGAARYADGLARPGSAAIGSSGSAAIGSSGSAAV
jgi:Polyketide cyclase / dehydrase and lipid transport